MNKKNVRKALQGVLIFPTAVFLISGWILGCGGQTTSTDSVGKKNVSEEKEDAAGDDMGMEGMKGGEHQKSLGDGRLKGSATTHMGHMSEVREMLKQQLGDKYDVPVPAPTASLLAGGKQVFKKNCVVCHGVSGKGDGIAAKGLPSEPADFTDAAHSSYYSDQGRLQIIRKGIPGTPMTGWDKILSEDDIIAVHSYIRSLRKNQGRKDGHTDHTH